MKEKRTPDESWRIWSKTYTARHGVWDVVIIKGEHKTRHRSLVTTVMYQEPINGLERINRVNHSS